MTRVYMPEPEKKHPTDPLIDEVRAIRRALVEAAGNDLDTLAETLRAIEAKHADRVRNLQREGLRIGGRVRRSGGA